jgi:hypothetical protein
MTTALFVQRGFALRPFALRRLALPLAAALLAATLPAPAAADDFPLKYGLYVQVDGITLDDGHNLDYATFLANQWKDEQEFARAQGWIVSYEVLYNLNKRAGEPDIYLVTRYASLPDAAESERRDKVYMEHMKTSNAKLDAGSAERAKFRHHAGSMLLAEAKFR